MILTILQQIFDAFIFGFGFGFGYALANWLIGKPWKQG